jgi:hypothetical protein
VIAALLTALCLGQATPAPAREVPLPPPPVKGGAELKRKAEPPPEAPAAQDPDEELIRNLELLEDLELLEHADAFDPGSKE